MKRHKYPDAYCKVKYVAKSGYTEVIWNSVDGPIPRDLELINGEEGFVDENTEYAPFHVPDVGARVFARITTEDALRHANVVVAEALRRGGEAADSLYKLCGSREEAVHRVSAHMKSYPQVVMVSAGVREALIARQFGKQNIDVLKERPPMCYDRTGKRITLDEYLKLMEKKDYVLVRRTPVNDTGAFVVTVWLGMHENTPWHEPDQMPNIFETRAFDANSGYSPAVPRATEEEALSMHDEIVSAATAALMLRDTLGPAFAVAFAENYLSDTPPARPKKKDAN